MTTQSIAKVAGSAVVSGALLLSGTGLAFAQTYNTTGTTNPNAATMTTGTTGGTGTTNAATTGTVTGTTNTSGSAATGTTGTTVTTPGVPNTGAGGDAAANVAVLGVSALVVAGGAIYLARRKYSLS